MVAGFSESEALLTDVTGIVAGQNVTVIRKRDNVVAQSFVNVVSGILLTVVSAPPPPSPLPPSPSPPPPPPPVFTGFTDALLNVTQLKITRQLINLLNVTARINALIDTTCYFPSNVAWSLFSPDANDQGTFVSTNSSGGLGRRLLQADEKLRFSIAPGVVAETEKPSRRMLQGNPFVPTDFIDNLPWNVTLDGSVTNVTRQLLISTIMQSCYNPPSATGSSNTRSMAIKLNDTDGLTYETALGWSDVTGLTLTKLS